MSDSPQQTCALPATPKFYIWNGEMLFLGTFSVPYGAHRVAQEKLIVCLEGSLSLPSPEGGRITTRSCLLRTGLVLTKGEIDVSNAVVGVCFLPPFSQNYPALESIMQKAYTGVSYDHPLEDALIQRLRAVRDGPPLSPKDTHETLRNLIIPPHVSACIFREFDQRVLDVVQRIRESISENLTLKQLADEVHLSDSRLEKLFKDQTGMPVTQHRLRYRVFISVILLALGHSVTSAALVAGFSNTAHFSRSFSAINGFAPSTTFMKPPFMEIFIDDDIRTRVESMTNRQIA